MSFAHTANACAAALFKARSFSSATYIGQWHSLACSLLNPLQPIICIARDSMDASLPDYLIREQAAVGALVTFGFLRVLAGAVALTRGWRIAWVEYAALGIAALWCAPQVVALVVNPASVTALAELEGSATGCAIALFFSPILSHRLGYE
jgi:hypothetical protein